MTEWDKTDQEWEHERARHRARGSRWMQTGPSERVPSTYADHFAAGELWVGHRVIAGDSGGLYLAAEPFDGYVYCIGADTQWNNGVVSYERVPGELLEQS